MSRAPEQEQSGAETFFRGSLEVRFSVDSVPEEEEGKEARGVNTRNLRGCMLTASRARRVELLVI